MLTLCSRLALLKPHPHDKIAVLCGGPEIVGTLGKLAQLPACINICLPDHTLSVIVSSGEWLFFNKDRHDKSSCPLLPLSIPHRPARFSMVKKTYDPVSTESNVTETPALFKLKRHKHYYMPQGNFVIQVNGSVTSNVVRSELTKRSYYIGWKNVV